MMTTSAALPWWTGRAFERFWLEITDRDDIGSRLWNYTRGTAGQRLSNTALLEQMSEGDSVLHYRRHDGVVAASTVASQGTRRGRASGREILSRSIRDTQWFSYPVALGELRHNAAAVLQAQAAATTGARGATWLPFHADEDGLRPNQFYIAKVPAAVLEVVPRLASWGADEPGVPGHRPSAPYREANEKVQSRPRGPFTVDPDAYDRSHRGHNRTQNRLARFITALGIEPARPDLLDPRFDLGFSFAGQFWVAEVKSTTDANAEHQLRLGLGQVLRYAHALRARHSLVRPVLIAERAPHDRGWHGACESVGVVFSAAPSFAELGRALRAASA